VRQIAQYVPSGLRRANVPWTPEEDALVLNPPPDLCWPPGTMRAGGHAKAGQPHFRRIAFHLQRSVAAIRARRTILRQREKNNETSADHQS